MTRTRSLCGGTLPLLFLFLALSRFPSGGNCGAVEQGGHKETGEVKVLPSVGRNSSVSLAPVSPVVPSKVSVVGLGVHEEGKGASLTLPLSEEPLSADREREETGTVISLLQRFFTSLGDPKTERRNRQRRRGTEGQATLDTSPSPAPAAPPSNAIPSQDAQGAPTSLLQMRLGRGQSYEVSSSSFSINPPNDILDCPFVKRKNLSGEALKKLVEANARKFTAERLLKHIDRQWPQSVRNMMSIWDPEEARGISSDHKTVTEAVHQTKLMAAAYYQIKLLRQLLPKDADVPDIQMRTIKKFLGRWSKYDACGDFNWENGEGPPMCELISDRFKDGFWKEDNEEILDSDASFLNGAAHPDDPNLGFIEKEEGEVIDDVQQSTSADNSRNGFQSEGEADADAHSEIESPRENSNTDDDSPSTSAFLQLPPSFLQETEETKTTKHNQDGEPEDPQIVPDPKDPMAENFYEHVQLARHMFEKALQEIYTAKRVIKGVDLNYIHQLKTLLLKVFFPMPVEDSRHLRECFTNEVFWTIQEMLYDNESVAKTRVELGAKRIRMENCEAIVKKLPAMKDIYSDSADGQSPLRTLEKLSPLLSLVKAQKLDQLQLPVECVKDSSKTSPVTPTFQEPPFIWFEESDSCLDELDKLRRREIKEAKAQMTMVAWQTADGEKAEFTRCLHSDDGTQIQDKLGIDRGCFHVYTSLVLSPNRRVKRKAAVAQMAKAMSGIDEMLYRPGEIAKSFRGLVMGISEGTAQKLMGNDKANELALAILPAVVHAPDPVFANVWTADYAAQADKSVTEQLPEQIATAICSAVPETSKTDAQTLLSSLAAAFKMDKADDFWAQINDLWKEKKFEAIAKKMHEFQSDYLRIYWQLIQKSDFPTVGPAIRYLTKVREIVGGRNRELLGDKVASQMEDESTSRLIVMFTKIFKKTFERLLENIPPMDENSDE
uniref:Uncharacterized protein n=1 Tax=Chromera velia CCMP2878 TaxID=1169474 RepID=A0A0G4H9W4_9ALVE|eukprot:Cvel_25533.t1-p1 / transcript=Cvel_25533.t1 / gene=Cvel_25533 / organism=Chromera_velia_CCMP2878 / gene_product=hypothetical protein / transcript_product=hypothetical protein / location=Cvel_scaffold2905:5050-8725(-) / protein_length=946 / sequence_SO=supercontig / SO=protein_coding / is_pseudo=false